MEREVQKGLYSFPKGSRPACSWDRLKLRALDFAVLRKKIRALEGFIQIHADVPSPCPLLTSFFFGVLRKGNFHPIGCGFPHSSCCKARCCCRALAFSPVELASGVQALSPALCMGGCTLPWRQGPQANSVHLAEPLGLGSLRMGFSSWSDRGLNERLCNS